MAVKSVSPYGIIIHGHGNVVLSTKTCETFVETCYNGRVVRTCRSVWNHNRTIN